MQDLANKSLKDIPTLQISLTDFKKLGEDDFDINGFNTFVSIIPIVGSGVSSERGDKVHRLKAIYNKLLDTAHDEIEERDETIKKKNNEISDLQAEVRRLNEEIEQLKAKTAEQEIQLDGQQVEIEELHSAHEEKNAQSQETISKQKDDITTMKNEIDTLNKRIDELIPYEKQNTVLKAKIKKHKDAKHKLRDEFNNVDKDKIKFAERSMIIQESNQKYQDDLNAYKEEILSLRNDKDELAKSQQQLDRERAEFKILSQRYEAEKIDMQKRHEADQKELKETVAKLQEKLEAKNNQMMKILSNSQQQQQYLPGNSVFNSGYSVYGTQNNAQQEREAQNALMQANPTSIYNIITNKIEGDAIYQNSDALTKSIHTVIMQRDVKQNSITHNLLLGYNDQLYVEYSAHGIMNNSVKLFSISNVSISNLMTEMVIRAKKGEDVRCQGGFKKIYDQIATPQPQQQQQQQQKF